MFISEIKEECTVPEIKSERVNNCVSLTVGGYCG